jgi:hypothetical protein
MNLLVSHRVSFIQKLPSSNRHHPHNYQNVLLEQLLVLTRLAATFSAARLKRKMARRRQRATSINLVSTPLTMQFRDRTGS